MVDRDSGQENDLCTTYEFDGNLLVVQKIRSFENDTKRTLSDLLADSVVDTDDI